jgi:hypothetical protein
MVQAFQDILVAIKGINGEEEAEGLQFMLEHERFGVGEGRGDYVLGVGPPEVLGFRRKELSNEALLALRMMFLAFKTLF